MKNNTVYLLAGKVNIDSLILLKLRVDALADLYKTVRMCGHNIRQSVTAFVHGDRLFLNNVSDNSL